MSQSYNIFPRKIHIAKEPWEDQQDKRLASRASAGLDPVMEGRTINLAKGSKAMWPYITLW